MTDRTCNHPIHQLVLLLIVLTLGSVSLPAWSHHSFAMFDKQKVTIIHCVVRKFSWTNPHVLLDVDVPGKKGEVTHYRIESASVNILLHQGWKAKSIKAGDQLTLEFNPLKSGEAGGLLVQVTLPDGTVLKG